MSRFVRALLLAAVSTACTRSGGPARTSQEAQARVTALLDVPDAGSAEFAAVGPGAVPALQAVLLDTKESESRRLGAARALSALPDGVGLAVLGEAVSSPGLSPSLRDAVADELGSHDRDQAVTRLGPLLASADASIRSAAARGLGRAGGPAARKLLEDRLEREEDPGVREQLQAALARAQP